MKKVLIAVLALAVIGCAGQLQQGGAYYPTGQVSNIALYKLDATYSFAYTTIDAAFTYEKNNRAVLWAVSPKIKHALDALRPQAVDIHKRWAIARSIYEANPVAGNLTTLQTILVEIQNISTAAQAAITAAQ